MVWSGTIDATCHVQDRRVLGIRITEGYVTYSNFRGDAKELGASTGSGGTWVSYGSGSGTYMDFAAASALAAFLEDGSCTEGWLIYVDGVKYC